MRNGLFEKYAVMLLKNVKQLYWFPFILVPLGAEGKTKKELDSEAEREEEEEGEEEGGEKKGRMSYPSDHVLEEDTLQYRVQGTFSHHRFLVLFIC